ncbi:hypothetical protein [Halomarina ordinaria]|uniref:Ig-like domain-containing protein n=1 Tax=Halomarina ordinaria TaxID=3033939 RepID=A0ABD5UE44_9EURY|nr:hypothetical protein [Halomarina sp. PSRA2]
MSPSRRTFVSLSLATALGVVGCVGSPTDPSSGSTADAEPAAQSVERSATLVLVNAAAERHDLRVEVEADGATVFETTLTLDGGERTRYVETLPFRPTGLTDFGFTVEVDGDPYRKAVVLDRDGGRTVRVVVQTNGVPAIDFVAEES